MTLKDSFLQLATKFDGWLATADQAGIFVVSVMVVIVYLARQPIANLVVGALNALMKHLSVSLPERALGELRLTTSVLLVTLSLFLALEVLALPETPQQLLKRVLGSIAVLAVFSGWYNLCGPFVSLLSGGTKFDIPVETGWMKRVARFGVVIFGITALLTIWEVDISGALTGVGVLGAGMAIATQDLIRNLVAGMNNHGEKRFSIGDVVQIEGQFIGVVEQIDLRSTLLRGFDQIPRFVPNSELSNAVVLNYSQRSNRRVMLSIPFVRSLPEDTISKVCGALREYLVNSGDFSTREEAPQYVHVEGLSDSAVLVMFYGWTNGNDYQEFLEVSERLTLKILDISRQYDAPLAYPTQAIKVEPSPDQNAAPS